MSDVQAAPERIIVTYRLRPGVTIADYTRWSLAVDQPASRRQPGVLGFEPHAVQGTLDGSDAGFDVFELVTVDRWEAFPTMLTADSMAEVGASIGDFVDLASIRVVHGSPVSA